MRVLVIGAGLAGLAATERLLDAEAEVVVIDSFPLPGGRTANFDVTVPVAGLVSGDVVEHGLHAWFQHYRALFGLMKRAGVSKPPFAGDGVYFYDAHEGHFVIEGGPLFWLINALRLPRHLRGGRSKGLSAFSRLVNELKHSLEHPERSDEETALGILTRVGVPSEAIEHVFAPCMYSLTSLPLAELSGLELMRWMSHILPDPRIRCLEGGGTTAMCGPIAEHLKERGAEFRFGVEVHRMALEHGRIALDMKSAPDRTGVRHILVPGFDPAAPPDPTTFDAVVCTLSWERLRAVTRCDPELSRLEAFQNLENLQNVHPLTIRLWFAEPIRGAEERYILSAGTLFDVLRPTREPHRYDGVRLVDALVENIDTHLPELEYRHERIVEPGAVHDGIVERVLDDLERMYPSQIRKNRLLRTFLHTREGIVACRRGAWQHRAPQYVGLSNLVLAGDWTRQGWGVCMEGAVRSGQIAVEALLAGRPVKATPHPYTQIGYSFASVFHR